MTPRNTLWLCAELKQRILHEIETAETPDDVKLRLYLNLIQDIEDSVNADLEDIRRA